MEALADMTPEQLEAIEGIGPKTVEKISLAVNNYFSSLEGGRSGRSRRPKAKRLPRSRRPKRLQLGGAPDDITAEVEAAPEAAPRAAEVAPAEAAVEEKSGQEETAESAEEPAPSEEKQ